MRCHNYKKVAPFFVTIERQPGYFQCYRDNHQKCYKETKSYISAMEVRASATTKNDISIKHIELLKDKLNKLEELHHYGCFTPSAVSMSVASNSFFSIFTATSKHIAVKEITEK